MPRRATTPRPAQRRGSGARTRAQIVAAAERRFAEQGFEATRLEDVAADVGIRRAAIFYYFRDKLELYDEVLHEVFRGAMATMPGVGSVTQRLEASLIGWIDYVAKRPSVARLILREAANAQPGVKSPLLRAARAPVETFRALIDEGVASGELRPLADPHRFVSLMGAATVYHFAAMPWMIVNASFDIWSPAELERHEREIVQIARVMLGIEPAPRRRKRERTREAAR